MLCCRKRIVNGHGAVNAAVHEAPGTVPFAARRRSSPVAHAGFISAVIVSRINRSDWTNQCLIDLARCSGYLVAAHFPLVLHVNPRKVLDVDLVW